ncbi:hypothetical protein [Nocardia bovistercoris]|uniref:DUF2946 domain-containing protein n=1 Tax=Nocardia bovistercoris TaxID=2785916 RepID=A0A931N8K8_9NOCA|nr:hypothetical protein [Nocardia bovistercoris]MBH0781883.1 hypothetical protein [Nocardia bovistercoris]
MRSLLLVIVVMAVAGMHHLSGSAPRSHPPSHHEHVEAIAPSPVAGVSDVGAAPVMRCCTTMVSPEEDGLGHGGHGPAHTLLHLCLAVLFAAVGLGLIWLALGEHRWSQLGAGVEAEAGVVAVARPPPVATSRRLASLCVLRV